MDTLLRPDAVAPARRLVVARNACGAVALVALAGIAFGGLQLAFPPRGGASEFAVFACVVSAIALLPALAVLAVKTRTLARVRRCCTDGEPTAIRVASDTTNLHGVRTLGLVDDAHGGRTSTWRLPSGRAPAYVELDPPSVAALRSATDPALVVPFEASGDPFAMSQETRRALLRRIAPLLHERPGVAASDALADHTVLPDTPVACGLRRRFVFLAVLAATGLAVAFVPFEGALAVGLILGFLLGLFALAALPGWLAASRRVRASRTGLELAGPGSRRALPWESVGQITLVGWNRAAARSAQSLGALAFLAGGALGYVLAAQSATESWVEAAPDGDDELELRLRHVGGRMTNDVLPDLVLRDAHGARIARFRGTLPWSGVESLLRTAAAHGVELQVG